MINEPLLRLAWYFLFDREIFGKIGLIVAYVYHRLWLVHGNQEFGYN